MLNTRQISVAFVLSLMLVPSALSQPRNSSDGPGPNDIPGGNIFGFSAPTDVGNPGDKGVSFEVTHLAGKRNGIYQLPSLGTELSATVAPNLALAFVPFVTGYRIKSVPELDDRSGVRFDGFSGEVSYRLLERNDTNPFAITVAIEPRFARVDGITTERVTAYATAAMLLLDVVLVPNTLFGAVNFNYAVATQRAQGSPDATWEEGSGTSFSGALSYRVSERLFIGVEARYLTAFEGATLNRFAGQAVFAGPNLSVNLSDTAAFSIAWTPQLVGHARGTGGQSLDLDNFERHQFSFILSKSF